MIQDKPMPNVAFRGMAFALRLMEPFKRARKRLTAAGIKKGQVVLEYGSGVGSYTLPAARIVGAEGVVYALDIHPLSGAMVRRRAARRKLTNIKTILSHRDTGLPDESVNVILLYDTLHLVSDKKALLQELHRILKHDGFLSADYMHTPREDFLETMQTGDFFSFQSQCGEGFLMNVLTFRKSKNDEGAYAR